LDRVRDPQVIATQCDINADFQECSSVPPSRQGAASVSDGIWMYQMTDKGLALEITAKGTKYSKDDDLNKS
jgi:hypothetical protein